eukprot:5235746-Pyramimonas_sp.AAC.1
MLRGARVVETQSQARAMWTFEQERAPTCTRANPTITLHMRLAALEAQIAVSDTATVELCPKRKGAGRRGGIKGGGGEQPLELGRGAPDYLCQCMLRHGMLLTSTTTLAKTTSAETSGRTRLRVATCEPRQVPPANLTVSPDQFTNHNH